MAGYDFRDYDNDDDDDGASTKPCGCCSRRCAPTTPGGVQANQSACNRKCSKACVNGTQVLLLLLAVGAGVGLGIFLRMTPPFDEPDLHPRLMWYLWFPAELLTRAMSLLATPLLVASVVSGVSGMRRAGRVGLRAIAFYLGTSILACGEGLAFVFIIKPAANMTFTKVNYTAEMKVNTIDTTLDIFRNIVPDNIISPLFQSTATNIDWKIQDSNNRNFTEPIEVLTIGHRDNINVLGLTLLAVLIGFGISHVGEKARPLHDLFSAVYEVIMAIIKVILWLLPLGVLFMVTTTVVRLPDDPVTSLVSMTWFLVTVVSGLAAHFLLVMPLLLLVLGRTNPLRHLARMMRALVTALTTNNSNMTLPVTMSCLEEAGYAGSVVRLLCPVGAAVNLDGACLYDAVAVIFITTLRGGATGPAEILTAGAVSVLLSVGVPSATSSLVVWTLLLDSLGLPRSDVLLLLPFDWLLGRLRTVVNVWGDSVCVAVVCHFSVDDIQNPPTEGAVNMDELSEPSAVGMTMNGSYRPIDSTPSRRKSYTLTVENEDGDIVKVSKV